METFLLAGQGVVLEGHTISRAQARIQAQDFLVTSAGYTEDDAEAVTDQASVVRAWWGGEEVGFVNQEFVGAQAVTVVNLSLIGASVSE